MEYLKQIGQLNALYVFWSSLGLFVIIFVRYLIFSGLYHHFFHNWLRNKFRNRFLNTSKLRSKQIKKEIYRSAISAAIFTILGMGMIILWQQGHTAIYTSFDAYPIWYSVLSVLIVLIIQDTFYYWLHRWMHLPKVYKWVHKDHHMSLQTSAFSSFSFHPLESLLQAIVLPLLVLWLPLHIWIILAILIFMTFSTTINHGAVEIYSAKWVRFWLVKWLIGASHHDDHHKKFNYNYGLYFTFWDAWMGTETPDFKERFEKLTKKEEAV
ncbi:MAG: sterol desaturase family protein [Bacteroidetes bacterium]|nr:MAG: sterol desaturase family protein [Bacteroidota bacterium]